MKTIKEVSQLAGVSIRTLHYYDSIGLLTPANATESGYRLYDDTDLERLQQILLFRELQFPLKEIKEILDSPDFDRKKALEQQIRLLELKKEHLENLIDFARGITVIGVRPLEFSVFDTKKIDEYARQAKEAYGKSKEYKEFEEKSKNRSKEEEAAISEKMMGIFADFVKLMDKSPSDEAVQKHVKH
ncbi:MAG: MerR family transcriptional regulator, partial [Lachnospiraceae bacterium]|nr:MerR family transcriptional regulator [Lachnospiraceae bacterium]